MSESHRHADFAAKHLEGCRGGVKNCRHIHGRCWLVSVIINRVVKERRVLTAQRTKFLGLREAGRFCTVPPHKNSNSEYYGRE